MLEMIGMSSLEKDKPRLSDDHQEYAEKICREAKPLEDKTMGELLPYLPKWCPCCYSTMLKKRKGQEMKL